MAFVYKNRVRLIIPHNNKLLLEYVIDEEFYMYPGGEVENYETIKAAAEREVKEELAAKFKFLKILYIREYIEQDRDEHSLELFILGELDNYEVTKNEDDPDYKETHEFLWIDIDKLPKLFIQPH